MMAPRNGRRRNGRRQDGALREAFLSPEVLELLQDLFRFRGNSRGSGSKPHAGPDPKSWQRPDRSSTRERRASALRVPPWRLGEVLLDAVQSGLRRRASSVDRNRPGNPGTELERMARAESAWALRTLAVLRLAASAGPSWSHREARLTLLESGQPISTRRLEARFAERLGLSGSSRAAPEPGADPLLDARHTLHLAELALALAPSDAGRITLALAARRAGRVGLSLACLREVLAPRGGLAPDACDAAAAWCTAGALLAAAGRDAASARAVQRSRALGLDLATAGAREIVPV